MSAQSEIQVLLARLASLEAESEIRRVMARYVAICDHLNFDTPMDELGALFARDAVWVGKASRYSETSGARRGREAILEMIDAYRRPVPHFAMNAHFLCSEAISVKGAAATGSWMMLQTSTSTDGRSDVRAARLDVTFIMEHGRWCIARFETKTVFSRPVERWDQPVLVPVPKRKRH